MINFFLLIFTLIPFAAKAQIDGEVVGLTQSRYLGIGNTKSFAQANITLKGHIDINGFFQIHTMLQSGPSYNAGFNTFYNFKTKEFDANTTFNMKRLYLQRKFADDQVTAQFGAMGTRKNLGTATASAGIGWVDGARIGVTTKYGKILITGGSLIIAEQSSFKRAKDFKLNYYEITFQKEVFDNLLAEIGVEGIDGELFINSVSTYNLEFATDRALKLVGETLISAKNGAHKTSLGINNVLSIFKSELAGVKLGARYVYTSDNISARGKSMVGTMFSNYKGSAAVLDLSIPLIKKQGMTAFVKYRFAEVKRIEAGVRTNFIKYDSKK